MAFTHYEYGEGGVTHTQQAARSRVLRGYAQSRKAYDSRRRTNKLGLLDKTYKQIVSLDPCGLCGHELDHQQIAVDHIEPLRNGGTDGWRNYTALCRKCNAAKGNKTLILFMAERNTCRN